MFPLHFGLREVYERCHITQYCVCVCVRIMLGADTLAKEERNAAAAELTEKVFKLMDVEKHGDLDFNEFKTGLNLIGLDYAQIFKDIVNAREANLTKLGELRSVITSQRVFNDELRTKAAAAAEKTLKQRKAQV